MGKFTQSNGRDMGALDIVSTAFDVAKTDRRIPGIQFLAGLLYVIPILGPLLGEAASGLAMQFADDTLGNPDPRNSFGVRFVYSLVTSLIVVIAVSIGMLFFVFPGVFLALRLQLAFPSIWIGDRGPIEAISDSWESTSGHLLTIAGVSVLFFVVGVVLMVPVLLLGSSGVAGESAAQGVSLLATPITLVGFVFVTVVVGSVSVAAQTIMYRAFGDGRVDDATVAMNDAMRF